MYTFILICFIRLVYIVLVTINLNLPNSCNANS